MENSGANPAKKFTDPSLGPADVTFGLVSLLHQTLKATAMYERLLQHANDAQDSELALFLRDCQQQDKLRAQRAMGLLSYRLATADARHDVTDEQAMESFPASDPPSH